MGSRPYLALQLHLGDVTITVILITIVVAAGFFLAAS
jgi:hypothetical protein